MGAKPSLSQQIDLGIFVRSRLWADVIELLADMVCQRRICHLGCALRPTLYSPDQVEPACYEVCGRGQLLQGRPPSFDARDYWSKGDYAIEWTFRCGRYHLLHF